MVYTGSMVRENKSPSATRKRSVGPAKIQTGSPLRHDPHENRLLDALPAGDFDRIAGHLELVPMKLGDILYEPGTRMRYVYFPTTSIVSLLYVMENGSSAEIAIVGNDGILGVSLFMGGESTPSRAVVQSAGYGFRLNATLLKTEFGRFGA